MSASERRAIKAPAAGLMVYDTTSQKMFVFTSTGWRALLYDVSPTDYSSLTQIDKPAGLNGGGLFGFGLDIKDNYALIGAPSDSVNGQAGRGSVFCYVFDGESWIKSQELIAADGMAGDNFGQDILIHNDWVFIGAPKDDSGENADEGSVYVYRRTGDTWNFHSKLVGGNSASGDWFGIAISASGNTLAIGAASDDIGTNVNQGSVYLFELQNNNWVQSQKIFTLSGGATSDLFGGRILLTDSLLFVGNDHSTSPYGLCQNAVYVYSKSNGSWVQRAKIISPDPVDSYESFGYSLLVSGQKLVVGSVFHNTPSNNKDRGAVYVFDRLDTTGYNWSFVQKIAPVDNNVNDTYGDYFGNYLSGEKNVMYASAHYEDVNGVLNQGAVYKYKLINGSWVKQNEVLTKTGFGTGDLFGFATATSNGWVLIGAPGRNQSTGEAFFIKFEVLE